MPREQRTARLTVLVDPDKKAVFEHLCTLDDVTPSQIIRRLIREFIEQRTGHPWQPGERPPRLRRPDTAQPSANKRARVR